MYRYAQINQNNICIADSFLSGKVAEKDMILLSVNEPSPLGKRYQKGFWEEVEKEKTDLRQQAFLTNSEENITKDMESIKEEVKELKDIVVKIEKMLQKEA